MRSCYLGGQLFRMSLVHFVLSNRGEEWCSPNLKVSMPGFIMLKSVIVYFLLHLRDDSVFRHVQVCYAAYIVFSEIKKCMYTLQWDIAQNIKFQPVSPNCLPHRRILCKVGAFALYWWRKALRTFITLWTVKNVLRQTAFVFCTEITILFATLIYYLCSW